MNATTSQYQTSKRDRFAKPLLGLAAVAATVATFALAVVAPTTLPPAAAQIDARATRQPAPVEVAILPGTIEVVATRTRAAQAASASAPANHRTRG